MQQIFGRAGRPQFEQEGLGIIITQHAQVSTILHYKVVRAFAMLLCCMSRMGL